MLRVVPDVYIQHLSVCFLRSFFSAISLTLSSSQGPPSWSYCPLVFSLVHIIFTTLSTSKAKTNSTYREIKQCGFSFCSQDHSSQGHREQYPLSDLQALWPVVLPSFCCCCCTRSLIQKQKSENKKCNGICENQFNFSKRKHFKNLQRKHTLGIIFKLEMMRISFFIICIFCGAQEDVVSEKQGRHL